METADLPVFSVSAYSGRRILAKWINPTVAPGRPYSGIIIRYSTSGYPGKTGGTQIYKGAGNNTAPGGQSQTYLDLPNINTTYYFSAVPYVTSSLGDLLGNPVNAAVKTEAQRLVTIKGTQNYTIPTGYKSMDLFCVGGGGGGGEAWSKYTYAGGGGGAGYTKTVKGIAVSAGQILACTVGQGGQRATSGGTSSVSRSGNLLCSAAGGVAGDYHSAGDGGSGGGGGAQQDENANGGNGGSDGNNGVNSSPGGGGGGTGQKMTTRAFGESSGTLYAGGGGGGSARLDIGYGGSGGGGNGGSGGVTGGNGSINTGGGGGGAAYYSGFTYAPGAGGSGVVLIRLY